MSRTSRSGQAEPAVAVLIVDDNSAKRLSIKAILEPLGHVVVEAETGEAALHAVLERPFAVILMDVQMPAMDGYETARLIRLRRELEHTPIIFITAHAAEEGDIPKAYASGAVDFMGTPLVPQILRAKVSVFVELFLKSRELERSLREVTIVGEQFRDSEARIRAVLENVADGIVTLGNAGLIESFNGAASDLLGFSEQEAIGLPFATMVGAGPPDAENRVFTPEPGRSIVTSGRRADGSTFAMELDMSDVVLGQRTVHIGCLRDISQRQKHTETLQRRALHDDLTGLPNRVLFGDRVDQAVHEATRDHRPLAILLLDLDGFKAVNDTFDHHHGDVLLKLVSRRLLGCFREGDTVARLGGDEFGILAMGTADADAAATLARSVEEAFSTPFLVEGHTIDMGASIGMALAPDHGDNMHDLLRRADLAMYEAKRTGAGALVFAHEHERSPALRLALLSELRTCIERGELVMHYQPKVDLVTKKTVGVEALLRWDHPVRGLTMPGDFMPEVENDELMLTITDWVLAEALSTLSSWRADGYDLTMAINLGARCLAEGTTLFETADRLMAQFAIPPECVTFELTEGTLLDTAAPGLLKQLQDMAPRLSIDDFGTGYSSLVYLQRLPVGEIKADRSFVTSLASVPEDALIVKATIDLAHNLGVTVVAEGVEDERTMDLLVDYGCDVAQGYFFSRPVPGADLVRWLDSSAFGVAAHRTPVLCSVGGLTAA